jgi:hypothetical protein
MHGIDGSGDLLRRRAKAIGVAFELAVSDRGWIAGLRTWPAETAGAG